MKNYSRGLGLYVIIIMMMICILLAWQMLNTPTETTPYNYNNLITQLQSDGNEIKSISIKKDSDSSNAAVAKVTLKDNTVKSVQIIDLTSFQQIVNEAIAADAGFSVETYLPDKTGWLTSFLMMIVIAVISVALLFFFFQQMQGGGGGGKVMSFGKSKARTVLSDKNKITFEHVAGLEEEKGELEEIVEFLKSPKKFVEIGARIPKGVLLVGPPGTGKTLLAKAVAGEAGVPFFSISGSDFVEMFVGVGASRVRDLFEQAKKNSPAIVFIDEIDAVGRRRGAGLGGGHDEREQTLNQLLVEMDGFGVNEGVIILAATNRADILDPALLRPGRFDRRVAVTVPDVKGREAILNVHAKGKKFAEDVELKSLAQTTSGFTGADLENLLNEAALLSARDDKKEIDMEELRRALVKVGVGTERKSRVISDKEKRMVAYHEAGHAIVLEMLNELDHVHIISVIPTGLAGGYTMHIPAEDRAYTTKTFLEQSIVCGMGGRAAEALIIGDITTGASGDINTATSIARNMVMKYGMSDILGPIQLGDDNEEIFIGRDLAHTRNYGEDVATAIDNEINRIITSSYDEAVRILNENMDVLHRTADLLIEKEKITGAEFRELFTRPLPKKVTNAIEQDIVNEENTTEEGKTEETKSEETGEE